MRLDENEESLVQAHWLISNNAEGGQVYLLNAEPGRYAAIGCYYRQFDDGKTYTAQPDGSFAWEDGPDKTTEVWGVFSGDFARRTIVTVEPHTFAFMGEYEVDFARNLDRNDDEQSHFAKLIAPEGETGFWEIFGGATDIKAIYGAKVDAERRDPETETKFLTQALHHFSNSEWPGVIQRRLDALTPSASRVVASAP